MSSPTQNAAAPAVAGIVAELAALLAELAGHELDVEIDPAEPESIRRLGLTSVRLLEFMIAVEDDFDIEWDDDLEPAVASDFSAMAAYIASCRGAAGSTGETR